MKTLKDIIDALQGMPISEFKDRKAYAKLREVLTGRDQEWFRSDEFRKAIEEQNAETQRKALKEAKVRLARARQVQDWLKTGELKKGTFIKVSGTRDRDGIREMIEQEPGRQGRLVCRQWHVASSGLLRMFERGQDPKKFNYELKHGMWMQRQSQITTHNFNKVVKILKG